MELDKKIQILTQGAKYDVSCSSSGVERRGKKGQLGSAAESGICHSFTPDGRCISLLKILMSNNCDYNCAYCINRQSNDVPRATFTPEELVNLTMDFYRRNYIEGLFLSSAVCNNPDHTMERMVAVVRLLRKREGFNGYIHLKGIPGASEELLAQAGQYADRMSMNLELPTKKSLKLLAPQKSTQQITAPMHYLRDKIEESKALRQQFTKAPNFVPAGQTTQMMIGATNDSDYNIMTVSEGMYNAYQMKRVYYSAYIPVVQNNSLLPTTVHAPLLREHRLYQTDWLLRFYGFKTSEILDEAHPNLDLEMDPKCYWALNHLKFFPVEVNRAHISLLLRVPGIGPTSAQRIVKGRRYGKLDYDALKKMGVVLKRAKYFILCDGKFYGGKNTTQAKIRHQLVIEDPVMKKLNPDQLHMSSLFPEVFSSESLYLR
ncbi:MAG: putative DNA modification/repair radical SAM protein [Clostridia bacterium]|nr:putative DNA modification/repair radical SAM protein [Clostridia bacterium]